MRKLIPGKVKFFITLVPAMLMLFVVACKTDKPRTPKAVFIIVDGIPEDVIRKLQPATMMEIAKAGGIAKSYVGGDSGNYNQSPTISAVGYHHVLTGTWTHKHNVWDNDIDSPNYNYWNIFRIAETTKPELKTAVFSTWADNRTKLIGEGIPYAGNIMLDYKYDSLEHDTVRFPHDKKHAYIAKIDSAVAREAARYISAEAPDLSWVYMQYTDDMGHAFGDDPKFYDAIQNMDKLVGQIWKAVKERERDHNEDWLVVITTDHGRDAATGKHHGGQSQRERTTWIITNSKKLNNRFQGTTPVVDIMPSIANHLGLAVPDHVRSELDGVPFIGKLDFADLKGELGDSTINLSWKNYGAGSDSAEVYVVNTNNFAVGGNDDYKKLATVSLKDESFSFPLPDTAAFHKVMLKSANHYGNTWVIRPPKKEEAPVEAKKK